LFTKKYDEAPELITFSDLMLLPGKTETEPDNIELVSRVTKNIRVEIPYVSSPMDTVTGASMGIQGLIIH
jgi:IMP dehydrogenase